MLYKAKFTSEEPKKKKPRKINITKHWFLEKIIKIDKSLAKWTKRKREKTQIIKMRNESESITTDSTEIKRIR